MELTDYIIKIVEEINAKSSSVTSVIGLKEITELIHQYGLTGGKKLRSVLCALVCDTLGGNHRAALDYAMAVELTHQASLVHDDIVDGDMFRRNKLTISERHGVGKALIIGDVLVSFAINAIKDMSPFEFASGARQLAPSWSKLAEGAYMEHVFMQQPTAEKYYKMIEYKTGVLYEVAAKLGAVAASSDKDKVDRFGTYGLGCGISFQMTDDLADVLKSQNNKKFIGDLVDRKMTLPIILMMANDTEGLMTKYSKKESMTEEEQTKFLEFLDQFKVITATKDIIEKTVDNTRKCVDNLPDSDYKKLLLEFPDYIVQSLMLEIRS